VEYSTGIITRRGAYKATATTSLPTLAATPGGGGTRSAASSNYSADSMPGELPPGLLLA